VFSSCDRRRLLAGLAASAAALALPGAAHAAESVGYVEAAKGRSTGLLSGSLRGLDPKDKVYLLELIQTYAGARLAMLLGGRTRVRMGERTRLKIEEGIVGRGGVVLLQRGAVLFDSEDEGGGGTVRTPLGVIAARGTRFFVGPSNDVIGVFVERGVVTVTNRGGSVTLEAGEGTNLTSPDVAPTPPSEWGAPRIAGALASVT
jgi:ferric-dicitrate binding protein FerR (iron transport regulator)